MPLWFIEPDPLSWAMPPWPIESWLMELSCPMELWLMPESDDMVECPMLSCDMLDELLWASAGTAKDAARRAAAARIGTRLNM